MPGQGRRRLFIAATFVGACWSPSPAAAQKVAVSVDCKSDQIDGAERETCASPDLVQLASSVDSATKALETTLKGKDKDVLLDTEKPLRTQRNDCQNQMSNVGYWDGTLQRGLGGFALRFKP